VNNNNHNNNNCFYYSLSLSFVPAYFTGDHLSQVPKGLLSKNLHGFAAAKFFTGKMSVLSPNEWQQSTELLFLLLLLFTFKKIVTSAERQII